jgi:O-antigen biosynthesis protein WbqP
MNAKRIIDFTITLLLLLVLFIPSLIVALLVKSTSKGPVLFWSGRVGRKRQVFKVPKFRTMVQDTPLLATRDLHEPKHYLTPIGAFLRKSSLDEIPQLWCVLKGDMSLVGPRPVIESETDLLELRELYGIDEMLPGLTGWAQVNGRDFLSTQEKIKYDREYKEKQSIIFDFKIMIITFWKVVFAHDVLY